MNSPPLPAPPWQTLLVLASERQKFFASHFQLGVTQETSGGKTARLYGGTSGVAQELVLDGDHLAVVQNCANGEEGTFIATLRAFLESRGCEDKYGFDLVSLSSAATPATNVARGGPSTTVERLNGMPAVFVLSSPRSGSSLLQLCLQVNQELYAGQELHLLPFATMLERRKLGAFELLEGLVQAAAEVRRCDAGDAGDWVASQEEQAVPIWRIFQQLKRTALTAFEHGCKGQQVQLLASIELLVDLKAQL